MGLKNIPLFNISISQSKYFKSISSFKSRSLGLKKTIALGLGFDFFPTCLLRPKLVSSGNLP